MSVWFWTRDAGDWNRFRHRAAGAFALFVGLAMGVGCDSDPFTLPEREELKVESTTPTPVAPASTSISSSPEARSIELVMDRHDPEESEIFRAAARTQAGRERVRLRISALENSDLSSHQAELVRQAAERKPVAVIVEPADPSDLRLAQAVAETSVITPVFVLYRPLEGLKKEGSAATKPARGRVIMIVPPSFTESAGQLVASAIRNAKNASLDPTAGAIVVVNTVSDPFVDERVRAIHDQLKLAGVKQVSEIRFASRVEDCVKQLTERLKKDPKPTLVFGVDSPSMSGCREVSNQLIDERPFITAGYSADEQLGMTARSGDLAAVADFMPTRLVRKAIAMAAEVADGKAVPDTIELAIVFHDSPPTTGVPRTQSFYKSRGGLPTAVEKK